MEEKKVFVVVGPTAVGKTGLAIKVAKQLNTEIISADSRQCYKELNIGVAKPNTQQLQQIHHYFINSHNITENVSAGLYEDFALHFLNKIFEQNDTAVVVGGTGLYIKALCEGFDSIPKIDAGIREKIIINYNKFGLDWLQKKVQEKDNLFWNKSSEKQNPQRLMRALEVIEGTGKSILSFSTTDKKKRPFTIYKIGLELDREDLYRNINDRVDLMFEDGLIKEVENLKPYSHLNALQTVGYTELFGYFNKEITLSKAIEMIKQNTRHYAKRQMTWFKKDAAINWFSPLEEEKIFDWVKEKLDRILL
jgi:tRNA dimethylallyltransferase